jgi:hypothetical protein
MAKAPAADKPAPPPLDALPARMVDDPTVASIIRLRVLQGTYKSIVDKTGLEMHYVRAVLRHYGIT